MKIIAMEKDYLRFDSFQFLCVSNKLKIHMRVGNEQVEMVYYGRLLHKEYLSKDLLLSTNGEYIPLKHIKRRTREDILHNFRLKRYTFMRQEFLSFRSKEQVPLRMRNSITKMLSAFKNVDLRKFNLPRAGIQIHYGTRNRDSEGCLIPCGYRIISNGEVRISDGFSGFQDFQEVRKSRIDTSELFKYLTKFLEKLEISGYSVTKF